MPTKVKGTTGVDKVEAGAVITNPAFSGNATVSGSLTVGGVNVFSGPYRNLIINGDMQIAQRGTSVSGITTDDYRTVDRFRNNITSAGTWTISQDTDVPTGQGFVSSIKYSCTTSAPSLTGLVQLLQKIEGQNATHLKYGTASAETTTFSFWVKSNKTGTYIYEIYQADASRAISKSFTISSADTWEKKIIVVEGDTSGVINNDNGEGYRVTIWLAAGSIYTSGTLQTSWASLTTANRAVGQVNLADSTSNYINITGVQLEVGEGASDFEFLPYDVQLQRCQRYFIKEEVGGGACADDDYSLNAFGAQYPTTMRTQPTVTVTNAQFSGHHGLNPSGFFQQSRQGISWYWDGSAYRSIGSRVFLTYAASAEL